MKEFKVLIKEEALNKMQFLKHKGIEVGTFYEVLGTIGDKLLLSVGNGEMVEVFADKCLIEIN